MSAGISEKTLVVHVFLDACRLERKESIFDRDTSDWLERMHVWYGCIYGWRWVIYGIIPVQEFGTPFHYYSTTRH